MFKVNLNSVFKWIDSIPTGILVFFSIWMLIAPIHPEPHLVQKFSWIMESKSFKAIDVFDVIWHLLPSILLLIKWQKGVSKSS